MGWQFPAFSRLTQSPAVNSHVGVGDMEPVANAQSVILLSPAGDR